MLVMTNQSAIQIVSDRGLPLSGNDIDTDRIIPARFMKCVTFDELGKYAFYDARFHPDGTPKEHPFNEEKYKGAAILIVNRNFGCGSSREHAPQSLKRFGIKAIIGESFAEIFSDNCTAIGLPIVIAQKEDVENLMAFVREKPEAIITVDLQKQEAIYGDFSISIVQPEQVKTALTKGTWDTTAELLSAENQIKEVAGRIPYLNGFQTK